MHKINYSMEITDVKTTQERVKAYHESDLYSIDYDVTLGEDRKYQNINGTVKELSNNQVVGYINKSYEFSIRTVNGKEDLFMEISQLAMETLALLDEEIKKL